MEHGLPPVLLSPLLSVAVPLGKITLLNILERQPSSRERVRERFCVVHRQLRRTLATALVIEHDLDLLQVQLDSLVVRGPDAAPAGTNLEGASRLFVEPASDP
jgi:hypothetical protein